MTMPKSTLLPLASTTAMYAVIATGGKQERVSEGQQVAVELLRAEQGSEVSFRPVLVVDGDSVLATPAQLSGASVTGRILGESKGPKIDGFTYKAKANQRKRWGHRQRYHLVEITKIAKG
jgi:large subunit ribosomal protein L21